MKTIIVALLLVTVTALADDIIVTASGPYMTATKVVTTNETTLGGLNWDALDGGGSDNISAILDGSRVVITEYSTAFTGGIGNETTSKNYIPTNKIPYTFTLSQTTVTVSRADSHPSSETK